MSISTVFTLEDFVAESLDFIHSNSYYELKKECLEYQLESVKSVIESNDILTVPVFESSDQDKQSKIKNLKSSILKRLTSLWHTLVKALKTFLKNVVNIFNNKQNNQIKDLEAKLEDANSKIDNLNRDNINKESEIQRLKNELESEISKAAENDKVITYLRSSNYEKEIQIRSMGKRMTAMHQNNNVETLNKKILTLIDAHKNNKADAEKVLNLMKLILVEEVSVENVPSFIINIDEYILKFNKLLSFCSGGHSADIIQLFVNTFKKGGVKSRKKTDILIDNIIALTNSIKNAMEERINGDFTIEGIEKTNETISNAFPDDQPFTYDPSLLDSYDDLTKKFINDNPELFGKYITAVSELSAVFKTGIGEYIAYTKDILDARQWAIEMQTNILNIIRRIDMNKGD